MTRTNAYIWSDTIEGMIPRGFTSQKGFHYTWNEDDEVYYRDDVDDRAIEYDGVNWQKVAKIG